MAGASGDTRKELMASIFEHRGIAAWPALGRPLLLRSVTAMALLAVLGSVDLARSAAAAAMDDAYSHDFSAGESHTDWMSALPDELRLSDLSVPGTHDSGASRAGGDITLTQSM